jgi:DNA-directed RNA polymerase subunit H (RpoH/RPB5)
MRHGVRKELTERNDILKKYQAKEENEPRINADKR